MGIFNCIVATVFVNEFIDPNCREYRFQSQQDQPIGIGLFDYFPNCKGLEMCHSNEDQLTLMGCGAFMIGCTT